MKETKRTEPMRQIKFECSEEFYERLNEEKLIRNLTLQQLAIRALEWYFALPESVHRRLDETGRPEVAESLAKFLNSRTLRLMLDSNVHAAVVKDPERVAQAVEIRWLLEGIQGYMQQFPADKLRLLEKSLALDLKYYRSARIKPTEVFSHSRGGD